MCPKCGGKSESCAHVKKKKNNETNKKIRFVESGHVLYKF